MKATLLVGPTGVGKSPFGQYLERHGFGGQRCAHLDFGAHLRAIAAGERVAGLTHKDVAVVVHSLATGALLENETFFIAEAVVRAFIRAKGLGAGDRIVLNGLPRHVDQARDVDRILQITDVLVLTCEPAVVLERIRSDAGGDRTGRTDDEEDLVRRKLETFAVRTRPVLDHYRARGVQETCVRVSVDTGPQEIVQRIRMDRTGPVPMCLDAMTDPTRRGDNDAKSKR